mgnify:CR=1|jgi:hypothetical protein
MCPQSAFAWVIWLRLLLMEMVRPPELQSALERHAVPVRVLDPLQVTAVAYQKQCCFRWNKTDWLSHNLAGSDGAAALRTSSLDSEL